MKKLQNETNKNNQMFFKFFEFYLVAKKLTVLLLQIENRKINRAKDLFVMNLKLPGGFVQTAPVVSLLCSDRGGESAVARAMVAPPLSPFDQLREVDKEHAVLLSLPQLAIFPLLFSLSRARKP
jgi:hypothetical protein